MRGDGMKTAILLVALWGVLLPSLSAWGASGKVGAVVDQAARELKRENYEEALDILLKGQKEGLRSPELSLLLGRTYRAMLNYSEARRALEEALSLKPGYPEAQLLLADTYIALDQPALALPLLQDLERQGFEPGNTAYLQGMAAYKEKRYPQALEYFRRAQQDPKLAQEAKFQESLTLAAMNRLPEAQKTMREAISLNPLSPTAGLAQGFAAALEGRTKDYQRFRFYGALGFDYDSNVTLQPGDPGAAQLVSGKGDVFYSQTALLEFNLLKPGPWALWTFYSYYQNFHFRIGSYDLWSNTIGLAPIYTWSNSRLWVPFAFNYSNVGSNKYATSYTLAPTYLYLFTPAHGLEVSARLARRYYWFPISFQQDERSGRAVGGSLAYYFFFKKQEGYLQARFTYEHEFTGGSNWDSNSYRFGLAALYPVTKSLKIKAFGDIILQPYNHFWTDGNIFVKYPRRDDKIYMTGIELTQQIYKGLELNLHYYYVRDDSNIALYDYDRHIVGGQLGYRY